MILHIAHLRTLKIMIFSIAMRITTDFILGNPRGFVKICSENPSGSLYFSFAVETPHSIWISVGPNL